MDELTTVFEEDIKDEYQQLEGITLSKEQLEKLNNTKSVDEKAKLISKWFSYIRYDPDPVLIDELKQRELRDSVTELYWNIVNKCDENGYDLFNKLNSEDLYNFMFNK